MQPSFDLRIRTMQKALEEVIIPAVDKTNSAAIEQANLVAGSLCLLNEQIDYAHWFAEVDIFSHRELLESLVAACEIELDESASKTLKNALAAAGSWNLPLSELEHHCQLLRNLICDLIETICASEKATLVNEVSAIVVAHSESQLSRERAYVSRTNFDVYPDTLKGIGEALAIFREKDYPTAVLEN